MNESVVARFNSAAVTAYKVVGFLVLAGILLAVGSYLTVQSFFLISERWVAPAVISSTDENVLRLSARVAEIGAARDRLAGERRELLVGLEDANRRIAAEQEFQEKYRRALAADRASRARELAEVETLKARYAETEGEVAESNRAFAKLARARAEDLRAASLLEREGLLGTNHQLAQIASSNLTLAEHGVSLRSRLASLRAELGALDVLSAAARGERPPQGVAVGATALALHQQYARSRLELDNARTKRDAFLASIADFDGAIARYDQLMDTIANAPLLRAAQGAVALAFVPYENLGSAHEGALLYGCRLDFVLCRQVGTVKAVLAGETTMRHPVRNRMLRGVYVELQLADADAATSEILHVARKPLLF